MMNINDRVKITIQILLALGKAKDQTDLGMKLGYNSKSAFSQAINGKDNVPKILLEKLAAEDKRISKDWLINGIGFIVDTKQVYETENNELLEIQRKYIQKLEEEIERLKKEVDLLKKDNSQ